MSFLEIAIDCDNDPELKTKLEANGGALLKGFAEKAQKLVSRMCDENVPEVYEKACKEDPAMMAALRGEHDPDGKELLTRVTKEELVKVFGAGYAAGYQAGKKRKRMEEIIVDELNKYMGSKACKMDSAAEQKPPKDVVLSDLAANALEAQAEKQQKVEEEEEEKDEPKYKSAVATLEDANLPYRNAVAHASADGEDEEPKYQSLSA